MTCLRFGGARYFFIERVQLVYFLAQPISDGRSSLQIQNRGYFSFPRDRLSAYTGKLFRRLPRLQLHSYGIRWRLIFTEEVYMDQALTRDPTPSAIHMNDAVMLRFSELEG